VVSLKITQKHARFGILAPHTELFDQETGSFSEFRGDISNLTLGMPMDIEDARKHMRVEPRILEAE